MTNPKTNIAKGKQLEDFVAKLLRDSGLDIKARREIGSGSGVFKGDVSNNLDIHFECKNVAKMQWKETFKQIARDNVSGHKEVLVWHMPNTSLNDSKVVINIDYFIDLLLGNTQELQNPLDSNELKFKVKNARESIRILDKALE